MSKPAPFQPSLAEAEEIAANHDLQQLLKWYPDRQDAILAAWRRRNPHPGCTCPWHTRRPGRCCIVDRLPPKPRDTRHRRTPSSRGQYQEQLHK